MLYMKKSLLLAAALVIAPFFGAQADEHKPEAKDVTVTGVNVSLLEHFGSDDEKASASADHGKHNALKVTSAVDGEGNAVEGMEGVYLHYLPTESAEALLAGDAHAGATVTVTGKVFVEARLLVVSSFEAAGGGIGDFDDWDDLSPGSMSGQPVF